MNGTGAAPDPFLESLDNELSALCSKAVLCSGLGADVAALTEEFRVWLQKAHPLGLAHSQSHLDAVAIILAGLKAGRAAGPALEKLKGRLSQAFESMEFLRYGVPSPPKEAPQPGQEPQKGKNTPGSFVISDLDYPGFKDFLGEAPGQLEDIEKGLLALAQGVSTDVMKVYRPFHTLKGNFGFMGLGELTRVAHGAETLLEPHKKTGTRPSNTTVDLLLKVLDLFRFQLKQIAEGLDRRKFQLLETSALEGELAAAAKKKEDVAVQATAGMEPNPQAIPPATVFDDRSIRIGVEKMDALMEAVGELAICQSLVTEGVAAIGETGFLGAEAVRLGKIVRELRDMVLFLRMVPVNPLFTRMSRLVRELSRKTGKEIRVVLEGGETELDKRLVEELSEPLVHLIRNAVDHGLGSPEERRLAGKAPQGRLLIRAGHQAGDFVLEVEDDGKGLDFDKLREQGLAQGLLKPSEAAEENRLTELIFEPGFSTAEKVTEVSGRGVGMDAVKKKIESLKGIVRVSSRKGQGTKFHLRIPLTLALMDGILVRVGAHRCVLPAAQVRRFWAWEDTREHQWGARGGWIQTGDDNQPLMDLGQWFGRGTERSRRLVVVEVEAAGVQSCFLVDEVLGKQQVVIKGLGEVFHDLPGVSGGAILGDGKVGLILDVNALMALGKKLAASGERKTN
jgi:two-component system chemotaxis sensor kinase CheA